MDDLTAKFILQKMKLEQELSKLINNFELNYDGRIIVDRVETSYRTVDGNKRVRVVLEIL